MGGSLLGFTDCFVALGLALNCLRNLIVSTATSLETKIVHANSDCEVQGTWDADEIEAGWKLIDGDERDDFSCLSDEEISWPWLGFLVDFCCA